MSIANRLRALVLKLATPAEPKPDITSFAPPAKPQPVPLTHPAIGDAVLKALQQAGMVPPGATPFVQVIDHRNPAQPPQEAAKPASERPAEDITWKTWSETIGFLDPPPGWTPCRFANRTGPDQLAFVFGITKGNFGVWKVGFPVCDMSDEFEHRQKVEALACVTYLPDGFGIGVFADHKTACEAADLAASVPDWVVSDIDTDTAEFRAHAKRLHQTWEFHGLDWDQDRHAHCNGAHVGIWTKTAANLVAGKPEKLA